MPMTFTQTVTLHSPADKPQDVLELQNYRCWAGFCYSLSGQWAVGIGIWKWSVNRIPIVSFMMFLYTEYMCVLFGYLKIGNVVGFYRTQNTDAFDTMTADTFWAEISELN